MGREREGCGLGWSGKEGVDREGRQRGGEGERRVWGGVGSRGVDIRQTEGWGRTEKGGGWGGKEGG